mmetsp:Transcript_14311/g.33321  ORF Transcript_14311/g.33321 Transcript_14311/m.33321 type:complete len:118 (-) Transcript_14311:129-482(-)
MLWGDQIQTNPIALLSQLSVRIPRIKCVRLIAQVQIRKSILRLKNENLIRKRRKGSPKRKGERRHKMQTMRSFIEKKSFISIKYGFKSMCRSVVCIIQFIAYVHADADHRHLMTTRG